MTTETTTPAIKRALSEEDAGVGSVPKKNGKLSHS